MDRNPAEKHASERPPVAVPAGMLVVTVDRLPAWMLGSYGATWVATPALDSLAARGVLFDRVIVPATSPFAGVAAVPDTFAGLFAEGDGPPLLAAAADLAWRPCVVSDDPRVPGPGLAGRSGAVDVRLVPAAPAAVVADDDRETAIARLVDAAVERLTVGGTRFLWCHVGSLGLTWDAPDAHRQRYIDPEDPPPPPGAAVASFIVDETTDPDRVVAARQVFAGQVTLLDGQLARLFAAVQERERTDGGWAVLFVGVRGLPLGLHGQVGAGGDDLPYGEVVHVPALLIDPAGRMAAQRHGPLAVPADLGCTLADLIGGRAPRSGPAPEPWRGQSLLGLFSDWSARVRDRVIAVGPTAAAVVTPQWHCLAAAAADGGPHRIRLYAKPDDFFEQVDVADRCADVATTLGELAIAAHRGDPSRAWSIPLPPAPPG